MPSDSVAGFLDRAKASRVLFPEQVEQLIRQPDIPHSDLASLCTYLLTRGVLTRFQAEALRDGRGQDLSFAGYPIIDVIGPCRGGTAYRAMHPSLRTPLELRKFEPGAFLPADDVDSVVTRARTFGTIQHPNILPILDAGTSNGQPYAVLERPADASDLATMLQEVGGAMPGFLAAEYGWSVASALRAIHERGGWHGEVQPGLLVVSPIMTKSNPDGTTRRRPSPNAIVKLAETGLIPVEPTAVENMPDAAVLPYLPPERIDASRQDASGDIYGLGASLYLLLTGRPPFTGDGLDEVLAKVRSAEPVNVATLRPDVPAELAAVVMKLLSKRREDRPRTAADVCELLAPFCRPGTLPAAPPPAEIPEAAPASAPSTELALPTVVPVSPPEPDGWGVNPNAFAEAQAASTADTTQKRRRQLTTADKNRSRLWMLVGLCLHLSAVGLLVAAWQFGWFSGGSHSSPTTETERKPDPGQKKIRDPRNKKKDTDAG
jgi:serine/threonine protein kinase